MLKKILIEGIGIFIVLTFVILVTNTSQLNYQPNRLQHEIYRY